MQNVGTEGAMEWVLSHMEDDNFNEPLSQPSESAAPAQGPTAGPAADPETVMMLVSMGFTDSQAAAALKVSMSTSCHKALAVDLRSASPVRGLLASVYQKLSETGHTSNMCRAIVSAAAMKVCSTCFPREMFKLLQHCSALITCHMCACIL